MPARLPKRDLNYLTGSTSNLIVYSPLLLLPATLFSGFLIMIIPPLNCGLIDLILRHGIVGYE